MSLSITIDLSDRDLQHFRDAMKQADAAAAQGDGAAIVAAATKLLVSAQTPNLPDFIAGRLAQLDDMIAMLNDEGWALPAEDRRHVLGALVYFAKESDLIPDSVPVLGFLDDAIAIELAVRELKNELEAYDDFCDYRDREAKRRNLDPSQVGRADFLEERRVELIERIHTRRERAMGQGYGQSSGYASGKRYTGAGWRPSVFSFK